MLMALAVAWELQVSVIAVSEMLVLNSAIGYRVAQVRVIFTLPKNEVDRLFGTKDAPRYLAYVHWFTPFSQPNATHGMYRVSHASVVHGYSRGCRRRHPYPYPPGYETHRTGTGIARVGAGYSRGYGGYKPATGRGCG